jgi:hypothetical protein
MHNTKVATYSQTRERGCVDGVEQWYSTWGAHTPGGARRHLRGDVKLKKKIDVLFQDKH